MTSIDESIKLLDTNEYGVHAPPPYVCRAEILPHVTLMLTEWPSPWARFWHWFFFGVRWVRVKEEGK